MWIRFKKYFQISLIVFYTLWGISITGCSKKVARHVIIESSPPGANIFLEDKYLGITPLAIKQGQEKTNHKQKLQLVLNGYYRYQVTTVFTNVHHYTLVPRERDVVIQFNLTPDVLEINHNGYTPKKKITVPLSLGQHTIFAYKKNHPFLEDSFEVTSESTPEFKIDFPIANTGNRLQINSVPEEVEVHYRNHYLGTTPMTLKNLPIEPLPLLFKQLNYNSQNVLLRMDKKETRTVIARLNPLKDSFQIIWNNFTEGSQVTINEKIQSPKLGAGGRWTTTVLLNTNTYHYTVSHPNYYLDQGELVTTNTENNFSNTMVVNIRYLPKIPTQPRKILDVPLTSYNTITSEGDYFFLSEYDSSEIQVYDLSFNHIKTFSFAGVGDRNSPHIMTGFQYPGMFLLRSRIITSKQIYPFSIENSGLINPVYLISFEKKITYDDISSPVGLENENSQIVVFDNGDHRIKFFDFDNGLYLNSKTITARDYFSLQDPVNNVKREYLLPLRFVQAVEQPSLKGVYTSEKKKISGMIFTDIVNRDIKVYSDGRLGYFISEFENQPEQPYGITTYHNLVLVGDAEAPKVWVYDQEGNFVHSFRLSPKQGSPGYLFIKENRLYSVGKTASIYFLE